MKIKIDLFLGCVCLLMIAACSDRVRKSISKQTTISAQSGTMEIIGAQRNFLKIPFEVRSNSFLEAPPKYIGWQVSDPTAYAGERYPWYIKQSFSQLLPMKVKVNDSLNAKMTGFNIGVSMIGIDLFKRNNSFDLAFQAGFNTGRLRLYGNKMVRSQNAYFSPQLMVSSKLYVGRFSIQAMFSVDRDITSGKWRKLWFSKTSGASAYGFYQSAYTCTIGIGYRWWDRN